MFVFLLNYKHAIVQIPAVFNTLPTLSLPPHPLQLHVPSRPVAFPLPRLLNLPRQPAQMSEEPLTRARAPRLMYIFDALVALADVRVLRHCGVLRVLLYLVLLDACYEPRAQLHAAD